MQKIVWLVVVSVIGGCTITELSPSIRGKVVDAGTHKPIKNATVKAQYFGDTVIDQSDEDGGFAFPARHKIIPLFMNVSGIWGVDLAVEAEGYQSERVMAATDSQPVEYVEGEIIISPIELVPTPVEAD